MEQYDDFVIGPQIDEDWVDWYNDEYYAEDDNSNYSQVDFV